MLCPQVIPIVGRRMSAERLSNTDTHVRNQKETNAHKVKLNLKIFFFQIFVGWLYHRSPNSGDNCYLFVLNGGAFKDWISADHHCSSIGASLIEINDDSEQFFVASHFKEWNAAGVSRMWLGVRCKSGYNGRPDWYSHSTERK